MDLLIDTHAFIWFIEGDKRLTSKAVSAIKDIDNKCYISIAAIWEIAVKTSLGKLALKSEFDKIADFLENNEIEILPVNFTHIQHLLKLKYHHRDPFDRIMISQAESENLTFITRDKDIASYKIKTLWK